MGEEDKPGEPFRIATSLSPEAKAYFHATFSRSRRDTRVVPTPGDVTGWEERNRAEIAAVQARNIALRERYPCTLHAHRFGDVPVMEVRPSDIADRDHALVYIHGGGYVGGTAFDSLDSSLPMAIEAGLRVYSIDYTTAPRARFPVAIEQAAAAFRGLVASRTAPAGLALYAESAGGGLAMGALLKLRDEGGPLPASVVLWSPWADITETGDSYITLAEEDPQFRYRDLLIAAAHAYADPDDHRHPWVSAVHADFTAGFPPTLIQTGTREIFLSNSVRLHRAMKDAGCAVEIDLFDGMWHAFQFQPGDMPEARRARAYSIAFIRERWQTVIGSTDRTV